MRRAERGLAAAVIGFISVKLVVLLVNLRSFPSLRAPDVGDPVSGGGASLLVPARDEELNLRRTLVLAAQQDVREVLVLDDGSSDGTAAVVSEVAATHPRVRLVRGLPIPSGWVGKTWACQQLADEAVGDPVVFVDADVDLAPGAVAAVEREMTRQRSDVFSVFPRQRAVTLGERLTVPLIDDVLLCLLPHPLLDQPVPAAATANGQLLAFRREAYDAMGGHAGVRTAIVEDVRLAQDARRRGLRLGLALGADLVQVRMYDGYGSAVRGIGKSLLGAHGGARALMVVTAGWHLAAYTLPWLRLGHPLWRLAAALAVIERVGVDAKTGRHAWGEAVLTPVVPIAALPAYLLAARRTRTWKGRTYR